MDARVRAIVPAEVDQYLPAAAAMFTEELGVAPTATSGLAAYRRRVEWLIRSQRAFGIVDGDGRVAFKADLGAISARTCQVQGVWVEPERRGERLSEGGMAAVVEATRADVAPVVSLYVNGYNTRAVRAYEAVGFREVGAYATVLF